MSLVWIEFLSMKILPAVKKLLLAQANQKRKDLHWKYLWTNNGRIHLRKNENDAVITIQTEYDLHRIK